MRVLIAEDDAASRTVLRRSVEKLGHECRAADDYLSKPLDRDELQVRLASAYRVTQLHKRLAAQNEQLEKLAEMVPAG